jgi:L-seryl-tRNA(Ser) seleniumtransferase
MDENKKTLLKNLPKIDSVMLLLEKKSAFARAPKDVVKTLCRYLVSDLRDAILEGAHNNFRLPTETQVAEEVLQLIEGLHHRRLRKVVNATGIIIHTNLGRAPLSEDALHQVMEVAEGYSSLEFDLEKGQRGLRYDHVRDILCLLSGAEDALVVNNNAAAVLLTLNTLSEGKEGIVSRGELVEIGGEFRIPDIIAKSGALLREVGTTNRTRLADYADAIGPATGVILKVHTSNFRIMGFTEEVELSALVALGKKHGIPVMDDLGSGCCIELDRYGLGKEPTVQDAVACGVDVVTFSGDKLLGGPQAGIILGKKDILAKIKKNPLTRALRIDKLTLAALEETMKQYLDPEGAVAHLPVLKSLTEPLADIQKRAKKLLTLLQKISNRKTLSFSIKKGASMAGGGALPTQEIPTALISVRSAHLTPNQLEEHLRHLEVPIIARIADDGLLLDLRTITEEEFAYIKEGFMKLGH